MLFEFYEATEQKLHMKAQDLSDGMLLETNLQNRVSLTPELKKDILIV